MDNFGAIGAGSMFAAKKAAQKDLAFVIQFRSMKEDGAPRGGRVEHVASGRAVIFADADELPGILLAMLKEHDGQGELSA